MPDTTTLSIRIPTEVKKALAELAKKNNETRSTYISSVLIALVADEQQIMKLLREKYALVSELSVKIDKATEAVNAAEQALLDADEALAKKRQKYIDSLAMASALDIAADRRREKQAVGN